MSASSEKDTLSSIPSPCFVLEESKLKRNLELLAHVQRRADISIILAFKGFAMFKVFPFVKQYLSSVTASSWNEVQLANDEFGVKPHTYFVGYDPSEFGEVAAHSSHITFNSLSQFDRFKSQLSENSVGLRVNPEWSDVETDLYNPASSSSRLGMTIDQMPEELPKEIEGLHFHVLCESSAESLVKVLDSFEEKFSKYFKHLKWINMGGGHLITRAGYDIELLIDTIRKFRKKHNLEIILEPGGAVAWQTGFLSTKVLDIIANGGVKTAIIDGSFSCHMPDCLEMPYRPIIKEGYENRDQGNFKYRLGGVSCLAGDFLEEYSFDHALEIGDNITFLDMMHYTMVKTTFFNGVKHPSIGVINEAGNFQLVKEFGYEDYKSKLS